MSIFEYNEQLHHAGLRREGYEAGKAEGKAEDVLWLLQELGEVSKALEEMIMKQTDLEILKRWIKLAAAAESVDEFVEKSKCFGA